MKSIINGFFTIINREAQNFNADPENYEMTNKTFFALFWRLEAIAVPSVKPNYSCAKWLQNVFEHYVGGDIENPTHFVETALMERAAELADECKPYAIDGWFVKL